MKPERLGIIESETELAYLRMFQQYSDGATVREIAEGSKYTIRATQAGFARLRIKYGATHLANLTLILLKLGKIK